MDEHTNPTRGPARIPIKTHAERRCRLEKVSARFAMRTEFTTTVQRAVDVTEIRDFLAEHQARAAQAAAKARGR
jgi:hypothetical protein